MRRNKELLAENETQPGGGVKQKVEIGSKDIEKGLCARVVTEHVN